MTYEEVSKMPATELSARAKVLADAKETLLAEFMRTDLMADLEKEIRLVRNALIDRINEDITQQTLDWLQSTRKSA